METAPKIMGIVNVTPDSFSDGGDYHDHQQAIEHGIRLIEEGADILDIGGESTRPGADEVSVDEELGRVIPVITGLVQRTKRMISIDTRKPEVAVAAINAGARIWNDVSALTFSEDSLSVAARLKCYIVLMHAQGAPETMQDNPSYKDVVSEVYAWLSGRVQACEMAGIERTRLLIDPGIGFGKTLEHNLSLIGHMGEFQKFGLPVLVGASRKRFISHLDQDALADARLGGSLAAALFAAQKGASVLRVHDVAQTCQALKVQTAIIEHKQR